MKRMKWKEYARGCEKLIQELHLVIKKHELKIQELEQYIEVKKNEV